MSWTPPSTASTLAFLLIVGSVLTMFGLALRRAAPDRLALGLGAALLWMAATAGMAASGVLETGSLLGLLPLMGGSNLLAIALAFSPLGRRLAAGLPVAALVGFQAFRLPLELVLHRWVQEGVIPETMTWSGRNLDVLTGALALLLFPLLRGPWTERKRLIALLFNGLGLALLLNVMVTAVLSSPTPLRRYWDEPALQLGFHVPTVWIVPVCVAGALAGHLLLFRALARSPSPAPR